MKSTDLTVDKKLVLYSRMLDPVSFLPTTKFLTTIHLSVSDATGHGIAIEILSYLESKNTVKPLLTTTPRPTRY